NDSTVNSRIKLPEDFQQLFARAYTNDAEKTTFITQSLGNMPGADDNERFVNFLISEPTKLVKTIIEYELKDNTKKEAAKTKFKETKDESGRPLNITFYGDVEADG